MQSHEHDYVSCLYCAEGKFPLEDIIDGRRIYDSSLVWWTIAGALVGALIAGAAGYVTAQWTGIPYLGQFYSAGNLVAVFTAASFGLALGGLTGAAAAVFIHLGK
ncbi:MAG: hypothetical protein M0P57_09225 [Syntrophales bacterium]|jgi:hypothetical protein|nr:hypothetical protein [Syntrophales bacterium]MDY0044572.1 hypothetical protein [Syntrophales bacterium]